MRKEPIVRWFLGAALAAGTASPNLAQALSCAADAPQAPRDGDTAVPTDALIWGYGSAYVRLLGPDGEVVPVEERALPVTTLGGGWASPVLVPRDGLAPGTAYTLEANHNALVQGAEPAYEWIHFTTGQGPSDGAPVLPSLREATPVTAAAWLGGVQRYLELFVEHDGILISDTGNLGDVRSADDLLLDRPGPNSPLDDATPRVQWATSRNDLYVGRGDCMSWPDGVGDRADVRFGVLDLAGNFSGWLDTTLELPPQADADALAARQLAEAERSAAEQAAYLPPAPSNGSACSVAPGSAPSGVTGWLALAAGSVLQAARRLRRRSG